MPVLHFFVSFVDTRNEQRTRLRWISRTRFSFVNDATEREVTSVARITIRLSFWSDLVISVIIVQFAQSLSRKQTIRPDDELFH